MDKTLFETRAITFFHDRKFVFFDELQGGGTLKKMTNAQYAGLLAVGALVGVGAFMINRANIVDSEVKTELVKLGTLCDLIGINVFSGSVGLVLFVYADDLTDEEAIGKSHLIRGRLPSFKKFATRIGWKKMPVTANVFFVFSNSGKAFQFRASAQEHCKHFAMFNKLWVLPWGIDLNAKSVWAYRGLPFHHFRPSEVEATLFS